MDATKNDNAALGFGPRDQTAHLPLFLHLRTANLPGPDSIMRSEHAHKEGLSAVSKHNKEGLSADMTKNVCRDDFHLPRQ